jgi:hypothetical protein
MFEFCKENNERSKICGFFTKLSNKNSPRHRLFLTI